MPPEANPIGAVSIHRTDRPFGGQASLTLILWNSFASRRIGCDNHAGVPVRVHAGVGFFCRLIRPTRVGLCAA